MDPLLLISLLWVALTFAGLFMSAREWRETQLDLSAYSACPPSDDPNILVAARRNRGIAWKLTLMQAIFICVGISVVLLEADHPFRVWFARLGLLGGQALVVLIVRQKRTARHKINENISLRR